MEKKENDPVFRHVGIYVNDLEQMSRFYKACFRFEELSKATEGGDYLETLLGEQGIEIDNVKMTDKRGMILELIKTRQKYDDIHSERVSNIGCMHIAFTVTNLEQIRDDLLHNGGKPISECLVSPDGYAKVFFCKDPEGNYLELVEVL